MAQNEFVTEEFNPLSTREIEVLRMGSKGHTSSHIGSTLSISTRTVEQHFNSIRTKLKAVTRAHAVSKAVSLRII
jgi:DNA-binding CsgD family transcriptional regulator